MMRDSGLLFWATLYVNKHSFYLYVRLLMKWQRNFTVVGWYWRT